MVQKIEWKHRYSETLEPDSAGRWVRLCFYGKYCVGYITQGLICVEPEQKGFTAGTNFPCNGFDNPFRKKVFEKYNDAEVWVEDMFNIFLGTITEAKTLTINGSIVREGDVLQYTAHKDYFGMSSCKMLICWDAATGAYGYSRPDINYTLVPFARHEDPQRDIFPHCEVLGNIDLKPELAKLFCKNNIEVL